ncbi:hypothetical protein HOLleu_05315 [Holothuria leucospilota]|uniref:Uncharacterized protein n=1 Tax=Holothuria leucospilota TaxID=206669 RepID=A0A9Q1HI50_HOLLE|nr:hypothetical protein HOLleu_05315 [Holothuria leucospilota]
MKQISKNGFFQGDNSKDFIVALNDFSFEKNKYEGTFVRLEKCPPHIYGVVINEDGQSEEEFWKELKRLDLKLVNVGFTQQNTIKGCGNRMEVVEKQITNELDLACSTIFCLIVDFTTTTPFRGVEDDIRGKVGLYLDKDFAKRLQLPIPTKWVLTSQEMITYLTNKIQEKKTQCINNNTMYTTKDMESCDLQSVKMLVQQLRLPRVELKEDTIFYANEVDALAERLNSTI